METLEYEVCYGNGHSNRMDGLCNISLIKPDPRKQRRDSSKTEQIKFTVPNYRIVIESII